MPNVNGIHGRASKKRKINTTQQPTSLNLGRRQGLHVCKYCSRDISQAIRIRCTACSDFQLCVYCFAVGVELQQHRKDHPYQVHGDLSFPLYDLQWRADEEMLLLEGIDNHGLGNWSAVSKHVGSKTAAECKEHYFGIYIRSPNFPLPTPDSRMAGVDPLQVVQQQQADLETAEDSGAARGTPDKELQQATSLSGGSNVSGADAANVGALRPSGIGDTAGVDQGAEGLDSVSGIQPTEGTTNSKGIDPSLGPPKKVRPGAQSAAAGSMSPGAGTAKQDQQQLSTRGLPTARPSLSTSGQATALPAEFSKVEAQQPEITGFHAKRFEFDHEYDNDAELLISEIEFLPTDSPEEHNEKLKLVEIYNQRLTEREHRRSVVISRGLMDARQAQAMERRQTPTERDLHSRLRVFARYQSPSAHAQFVDGLLLEQRLRTRLEELKELRAAGVRTFEEAEEYEADKRRQQGPQGKAPEWSYHSGSQIAQEEPSTIAQGVLSSLATPDSALRVKELSRLRGSSSSGHLGSPGGGKDGVSAAAHLAAWRNRRGYALDITAFDGADLLSSKERQLCITERLLPHQYLAYKASLLREAEREGAAFTRSKAKYMFRLRSPLALKIYDFLVSCRYIRGPHPSYAGDQGLTDTDYMSDNATAAASKGRNAG